MFGESWQKSPKIVSTKICSSSHQISDEFSRQVFVGSKSRFQLSLHLHDGPFFLEPILRNSLAIIYTQNVMMDKFYFISMAF
jgi:hypothetical protein